MSAKQASIDIAATDEDTGKPLAVNATVDFINTGYVYLSVDDGNGCASVAIPDWQARRLAEFILKETR